MEVQKMGTLGPEMVQKRAPACRRQGREPANTALASHARGPIFQADEAPSKGIVQVLGKVIAPPAIRIVSHPQSLRRA
jgi:hypothetical protein